MTATEMCSKTCVILVYRGRPAASAHTSPADTPGSSCVLGGLLAVDVDGLTSDGAG